MSALDEARLRMRRDQHADEATLLAGMQDEVPVSLPLRQAACDMAISLVKDLRADTSPGLMEVFLAEYGLSTEEGVALMCLAEALLRVPDAETMDALIEDKIAPSEWGAHLGQSTSPLVNASTWALMLTGKVLQDGTGLTQVLRDAVRRLGEPVIRVAVSRAMRELGAQFVLGETIDAALDRGQAMTKRGYTYSFDMLGEAARTAADAETYFNAYAATIARLAQEPTSDLREGPGISIKLSALHPRYEATQADRVMDELVDRARALTLAAREAGIGLNIDAEEADRLDLSLDVIEAVARTPELAGWDGFGVVVQGYGKRAPAVIDWLGGLAETLDRRFMVRLVKGAYWDTEIKRAQVEGLRDFPVWTRKAATDVSYITCAQKLLGMTDRIYPQFATHNAHTVAAILAMEAPPADFEFQRLHGMGEALHEMVRARNGTRCRVYAPVGAHRDLLAYLVRRLLENGANSSFVNQIVDPNVPPEEVAQDPFELLERVGDNQAVCAPADLYAPERPNSRGWDLADPDDMDEINAARAPFETATWEAGETGDVVEVRNPAAPSDLVGHVRMASAKDMGAVIHDTHTWNAPVGTRAAALSRAADLYEAHFGELFALLAREAGKTPLDAIAELREAVDFLRYYAAQARGLDAPPRGVFACISPWNFPLAIFSGQIAAALAAGNGVVAKPAETTSLVAARAVALLHEAGVPENALRLVPGTGAEAGAALTAAPEIAGVCFTGSTATAQAINRTMAQHLSPFAPLIAETGGINAMVVDSTALPEQAVRDIIASAFQSAGQRCSALRMLYVQEDVEDRILKMLFGAMDELRIGAPWDPATDIGPVIDAQAKSGIDAHIDAARQAGQLLKSIEAPTDGHFVGPAVIRVAGIGDLTREVFGPVLHVARFAAHDLDRVIADVNAHGYGLTFGIHSRIDDRVEQVASQLSVGNVYVNRNQIGAIVGSQPFGGEGLSGTGPKAGGPSYVPRFARPMRRLAEPEAGPAADPRAVQEALNEAQRLESGASLTVNLPGPTGESNRLSQFGRGAVLCLGPTLLLAERQARIVRGVGCAAVVVAPGAEGLGRIDGVLDRAALGSLSGFAAVALASSAPDMRAARIALAERSGPILPLIGEEDLGPRAVIERHVCIDTTAAGGNARLLAESG
jgi:RHH-type proline utilization regulon transcriptional repressor/proline dehydrogenase/delta 1-pyrroline-5-carboxylate dehydrogenase